MGDAFPFKIDDDRLPEEIEVRCPREGCREDKLKKGADNAPFDYSCVLCGFSVNVVERDGDKFAVISDTYQ
jgi:hypothetical protein